MARAALSRLDLAHIASLVKEGSREMMLESFWRETSGSPAARTIKKTPDGRVGIERPDDNDPL